MVREIPLKEQLISPGFQRLALPIVSYIAIMFFLIQGPVLFPKQWDRWQTITLVYAMMALPSLIFAVMGVAPFDTPAWKHFAFFGLAAVGGGALFWTLFSQFKYTTGFPVGDVIPTVIYQVFVISLVEENFFRGFLLEIGQRGGTGVGVLASAGMFSIFHLAAYSIAGLNFAAFGIAFAMGIAFGLIYLATRHYAGTGVTHGLHAAYNLVLLFG